MTDNEITSTAHDENGRYYEFTEDSPFEGVTVNELDDTVTLHGRPPIEQALTDLLALERDRLLGYAHEDMHMDPQQAVQNALTVLEDRGHNPDDIVLPQDQETLDLETNDD